MCRLRKAKDVPETIQAMLDEIELSGKCMEAVETELMESASSTKSPAALPSIQCLAIYRCRQMHEELDGVVDDLSSDIASSRRRKRLVARHSDAGEWRVERI
jgi:hypothetical protein